MTLWDAEEYALYQAISKRDAYASRFIPVLTHCINQHSTTSQVQHKETSNAYTKLHIIRSLWWADPGWTPGTHQSCSIIPLLSWTGEKKYNERLVGRDKDRERSLTNYCHRQNRLILGKINLLPIKSE